MAKTHIDELGAKIGEELGVTDWVLIDQERIDHFAETTGDHQWIHVDAAQAAAGPWGTTIAHGYLTLSLLSVLLDPLLDIEGVSMKINYGLDKVRFPRPVPVDSKIRARVRVDSLEETAHGALLGLECLVESEGIDKPACVAYSKILLVRATDGEASGTGTPTT